MVNPNEPIPITLEQRRERVVEILCQYVSDDTLTLEEFERRVDLVHRAKSQTELEAIVADLPTARMPAPRRAEDTAAPAIAERAERQTIAAILGGADRSGEWIPARRNSVFTIMGGAVLDFREARLGPGITEVSIFTFWGGVEIIVPPDLIVQSNGIAIMGGFGHSGPSTGRHEPDARILRIDGLALMGGVEIKIRFPGETERDARKRIKEERRRLLKERARR